MSFIASKGARCDFEPYSRLLGNYSIACARYKLTRHLRTPPAGLIMLQVLLPSQIHDRPKFRPPLTEFPIFTVLRPSEVVKPQNLKCRRRSQAVLPLKGQETERVISMILLAILVRQRIGLRNHFDGVSGILAIFLAARFVFDSIFDC